MRWSHLVFAMLVCARLIPETGAAELSEDGRSSMVVADVSKGAASAAPDQSTGVKAARPGHSIPGVGREATRGHGRLGGNAKRGSSTAAAAPRSAATQTLGLHKSPSGSADRLHSLLSAQQHGRPAPPPRRSHGSTGAAPSGLADRGYFGARSIGQLKSAAPARGVLQATTRTANPRESTIGGPRVPGFGRVGAGALGRTNHGATIDGNQLHRKF